jgi:hypothetical protein
MGRIWPSQSSRDPRLGKWKDDSRVLDQTIINASADHDDNLGEMNVWEIVKLPMFSPIA